MKKHRDAQEQFIMIAIAFILGMAAITLFSAWVMTRPPQAPGTGVPGETIEFRENTMRFARESEALLSRAVQELETLPEDTHEVFYARLSKEYIANNGQWHIMENQLLIDLLEDTVVDYIDRENRVWVFHLEHGEDSLFEKKYYSIVYSDKDPSADLRSSDTWNMYSKKNDAAQLFASKDELYLEEIGNGFWYFYEYRI